MGTGDARADEGFNNKSQFHCDFSNAYSRISPPKGTSKASARETVINPNVHSKRGGTD